jgi:serine/threonine protein kinase
MGTDYHPPMTLAAGAMFAKYRIVSLLGSGGMGEVYLAEHPRLPRKDALKILPERVSSDPEFRERFLREADLAGALWHPNIVRVNDRGEFNGQLWIAMDYVDGMDVGRLISERAPAGLSVHDVTEIVSAVADALDHSHRQGLLHRDVKPANIMVTNPDNDHDRRVLLADYGIARSADDISGLTATNMTVGTVAYAAPEQLMGEPTDGRADQYALAATSFHLLTGSQPFPNSNPAVVISRHLNAPPPSVSDFRLDLSALDDVLSKALAKNPDDRYPTCRTFAQALASSADASPHSSSSSTPTTTAETQRRVTIVSTPESPPGPEPEASTLGRRRRWLLVTAVPAAVLVAVTTTWTVVNHARTSDPVATRAASTPTSSSGSSSAPPNDVTQSPTAYAFPDPDPNRPTNGNCPPACTRIPDSAWIAPKAIPLHDKYSWPPLAPLTEPVSNPRFELDNLCATGPIANDQRDSGLAAHVILPNPPSQWQLQVQILHWRGDPWIAGQQASAVMDSATSALQNSCKSSTSGATVSHLTTQNVPGGNPGQSLTAVITTTGPSPTVAHEYLISDLRSSTVVELAMSSNSPSAVDWPAINDDQLLANMVTPLCTAYVNSCAN